MKDRAIEILEFLARAGWDEAEPSSLPADFSSRRFARLEQENQRAILMDADPNQKTDMFVKLAKLLRDLNLSAPEIYAADAARGLVLMEDFGDRNFGRMLDTGADGRPLYRRGADVLIHLHKNFDLQAARGLDLPVFDAKLFATQVELFLEAWPVLAKQRAATPEEIEAFRAAWSEVLALVGPMPQTLMLRDFMPDNLMDLPDRAACRSTGVLDFQDAGIGPVAYDLASLSEVVRRDGDEKIFDELIDYYCEKASPQQAKKELRRDYRILAAQRHMRILGIIASCALKTGRRDKLAYAPRIWDYLGVLLQDEALMPVREWVTDLFRQPNGS